ncbi:hypothetical protein [Amycolatopsis sp. NPDC004079]|uniref:hypothetical protein n=1 Tax=Amycolatopsis sp. NPDC004079 TaxID=3154549 RepID=UPI0033A4BEF5
MWSGQGAALPPGVIAAMSGGGAARDCGMSVCPEFGRSVVVRRGAVPIGEIATKSAGDAALAGKKVRLRWTPSLAGGAALPVPWSWHAAAAALAAASSASRVDR